MIDFDNIDNWAPELAAALRPYVPDVVERKLAAAMPQYVEDARDLLLNSTARGTVVGATLAWLRSTKLAAYHGTRLADEDLTSICANGLIPMCAESRRLRLTRALSAHPDWSTVESELNSAIQSHGHGNAAGHREQQVHLTLSKAGLTQGFNHYITHGAEFDQHVAHNLLGDDGTKLLALDGKPTVIRVAVPGPAALDAADPCFDIETMLARGDIPNLVNEFLKAWSFRLAHPQFQSRTLKVDCGMIFRAVVPASWIVGYETVGSSVAS